MTEKELVDACIQEDRRAQKALWDKYSPKLFAMAVRYCKSKEEAEDALMESFAKIYDNMSHFKGDSSLETWMRRIVVNTSINKIRAHKITDDIETMHHIGFEESSFDSISVKGLMAMLDKLPLGYKTVFNLFAIEGYSHKEISEMLGIDEGTSRSQLSKAKKVLQDLVANSERINL